MPLRRFLPALLLLAAPLFAAGPPQKQPPRLPHPKPLDEPRVPVKPKVITKALVRANNQFALELYKQLRTGEGNLFFAPTSIASSLTLTSAGAVGKTREQMDRALRTPKGAMEMFAALDADFASRTGPGLRLTSLNRVWVQEGMDVKPDYLLALKAAGSRLGEADFAANPEVGRLMVNKWVEKQTERQIADLLPGGSVTALTRLVAASAVHFKGDWASKFKVEKTAPGDFHTPKGKATVPLMSQFNPFLLSEMESGPVIELPYAGEQLSMVLAVPGDGKKLVDVERDVIDGKLDDALSKGVRQKVEVVLPRFKLASSIPLPEALRAMGIEEAFSPSADFSGIDGSKDLYLSGVFHKAALDVSEEGTEATAATGVVISARSKVVFHADQPFVFAIRDKATGAILFLGRVVDPR